MELSEYIKMFSKEKDILKKLELAKIVVIEYCEKLPANQLYDFYVYIIKNGHYPRYEEVRAIALYNVGTLYYKNAEFQEALELLYESLQIYEEKNNRFYISRVKNNIAVVYNASGQVEKAVSIYKKLTKEPDCDANNFMNYAGILLENNQDKQALAMLNKAFKIIDKSKNEFKIFEIMIEYINLYNKLNQPEKSLETIKPYMYMLEKDIPVRQKGFAYLNISEIYSLLNDFAEAQIWLNKALDLSENTQNNELLWFSYTLAIDFYKKINNWEKALWACEKKQCLTEKIYKKQLKLKIDEIELRKNEEIKNSKQQNVNERTIQMASLGVMASGITHEINQPLNAIMIDAQALIYKDDIEKILPQSYRQRLQYIIEASERISKIIQHIRSYWVNKDGIKREEFDANMVISKTIGFVEQQIKAHQIRLNVKLYPDNLLVKGTLISLEQIIVNLVVNAIHALDSADIKDKKINIASYLKNDEVLIVIDDNGGGIPDEIITSMFEPFIGTKENSHGSGLGLALVKNFAKDLNACISYNKNDMGGCRFSISIPYSAG